MYKRIILIFILGVGLKANPVNWKIVEKIHPIDDSKIVIMSTVDTWNNDGTEFLIKCSSSAEPEIMLNQKQILNDKLDVTVRFDKGVPITKKNWNKRSNFIVYNANASNFLFKIKKHNKLALSLKDNVLNTSVIDVFNLDGSLQLLNKYSDICRLNRDEKYIKNVILNGSNKKLLGMEMPMPDRYGLFNANTNALITDEEIEIVSKYIANHMKGEGSSIYNGTCSSCHGINGNGLEFVAPKLKF